MDRGISRSVPYLPRYHSLSPARSPLLGRRRFTSLRSVSQPSQRIFYIDSAPTRVVNSYHVNHSPSPQRSYKVTICSSKVNHHLTRSSRSQSAHDLNSSHVYASQEDIFDRSLKEAAARQVGSCDDIYHKAPFFPDVTPSESGVSVGESEEGSIFGGEEDNMSQHSFGSSSAFYEITMDSELDRCDSDNFSGPDSVNLGDRTLDILYEDDLDENRDKRKRGVRRSNRDVPSPDSSCASPLSYTEARRRELMSSPSSDFDKTHSRFQQLRVLIPGSGSEASAKASKDQSSIGDRRSVSSSPLAQSTPHVSPRGTGESKLYVTASWDADDPFNEANGRSIVGKSKAARALFDLDIVDGDTTGHSSRIEDSSCNSSCSEDNYSDVSNATVSSPVPRKTKLVKKSSDKPGKTSISAPSGTDTSEGISRSHLADADTCQTKQAGSKLSPRGVEGNEGNEWWAVYNIGTAKEREAGGQTGNNESRENPSNYQRDIRIVKPLKVNIPLISAGKHGQEKLRKRSQTSPPQSPPKSPSSPKGSAQTWRDDDHERKTTDRRNTNTSHFEEAPDHELNELMKFDRAECHKRCEDDEEEGKQKGRVHNLSSTPDSTCENSSRGPGESSLITMAPTSQGEQCFQSLQEVHDNTSKAVGEVMKSRPNNNDSTNDRATQKEGEQFNSGTEIDSSECIPDSFPSPQTAISSVSVNRVGNCTDIDSTHEVSCSTDGQFTSRTSAEYVEGLASDEVRGPVNIDGATLHSDGQRHKSQRQAVVSDDENDRAEENSRHYELGNPEGRSEEAWKATDKFSSSATLPAETTQVFDVGSNEDTTTDLLAGENKHLNAGTSGSEGETSGNCERAENDVNISAVFNGNNSVLEDKTKDESSAQDKSKTSSIEEICDEFQGLYIGLKIESCEFTGKDSETVSSDDFNSCSSEHQESYLFTKSSPSKDIIDGDDLSNVSKENGQQQERGLSECPQDTSAVDLGIKEENTNMEKFIDPRLASRGGIRNDAECRETPQMLVRVVATAQKIDDKDENSGSGRSERHGSAFYSPRRGIDVTQQNSNSLVSPFESCDSQERVNTYSDWDHHFQGQISDNADANNIRLSGYDRNSNSFRQQEGVGPSFYKDSSKPVVDESIKQLGGFTRGDKGIQDGAKLNAERGGVAFVERGEEFIHVPSSDGKQVRITETSSKHVKHVHRTTIEKIVTTERRVNLSPTGFISPVNVNSDGVDYLTDRRTTETIIKEDDDYITTTTTTSTLCTDAGNQGTVSIENSFGGGDTRTTCLPASSLVSVTPTPRQESHGSFYSDPTTYVPSSSPVSTTRLAAPTGASDFNVMREKGDSWDHKNTVSDLDYTSGQIYPSDTKGTAFVENREGLTSSSNTSGPVMHHESPLDSLQAQLSRISGDLSPFETQKANSENESYVYQDHAEATSVLKQIVRGDTGDFSNFSNRSDSNVTDYYSYAVQGGVKNGGKLSESVTDIDNGDAVHVVKEQYDNDYDYVTTDLPKTSKHVSRPHHHIQLLKPGQLKASSLWTLNEETESVLDPQSPKPSPKRSLATVESEEDYNSHQSSPSPPSPHRIQNSKEQWSADENENLRNSRSMNVRFGQRNFVSESSDFDESDGNYSSISTAESSSHRSSSYGREQTPLSETDSVPLAFDADRMDYQEVEEPSQSSDIDRINSFHDFVSGLEGGKLTTNWANNSHVSVTNMETNQVNSQTGLGQHDSSSSSSKIFKTSLAFGVSPPEAQDVHNNSSILDNLSASLEQFSSSGFMSALEDRTSFLSAKETHSFGSSDSKDDAIDISGSSTLHSWHDDATSEASSRLHNLDLDLSRISSCASPVPSDFSEGSMYTCTGTAEVKKHVSFDYDIPSSVPASTPKANLKSALKRPAAAIEDKQNEMHREKVKQFEKLLNEFNISTCPKEAVPEMIFMEDQRPQATGTAPTNYDDLYKSFTNDDSEKKQNHSCIVVEDENMNTFRFKRFLKKSHTKRKKGRKLLRFFSRLSCVSESVQSPESSPKRAKLSDHEAHTYSTDSMPSSKHVISKPVLISSTSFQHHREFLNSSPQRSVKEGGSPSSSNQSLDSFRSRADSAYSSISESAAGALNNSPPSQHTSSLRVPPASSGSVSSVFHSGSVSGDRSFSDSAYSTNSDATNRTFSTFSESDFTLQSSPLPKHSSSSMDTDMMSALSDVFDQLNSCEEEIDTALLNRMRHGHARASTPRK